MSAETPYKKARTNIAKQCINVLHGDTLTNFQFKKGANINFWSGSRNIVNIHSFREEETEYNNLGSRHNSYTVQAYTYN